MLFSIESSERGEGSGWGMGRIQIAGRKGDTARDGEIPCTRNLVQPRAGGTRVSRCPPSEWILPWLKTQSN